jgi:spore coat protein H
LVPVDIKLAEADLKHLLANATDEKEYLAAVNWNGQQFPNIALRAKGNSSLSHVARSGSKRVGLKLYLDRYISGQSLDGVGTINLQNSFSDPSYLRELLSYEAFASLGISIPNMTWVRLTINSQLWGLYLAVEQVAQPFLERHFGDRRGDLYKPESFAGAGADLRWHGDSYADYPGIVYKGDNKKATHTALMKMLDALNNGGDLEQHLNVDEVLRYWAVSAMLAHFDSYPGFMLHNYYLYEQDGRFSILPWDLNMSFGGFGQGASLEQMVTGKIDEPTMGPVAERPLIAKLLEVPEFLERYHRYIRQLTEGYFDPVTFEARARQVQSLIDPYVKEDPTKFYTYEQFRQALDQAPALTGARGLESAITILPFVRDRVTNVKKQLDGTLPTKGDGSGLGLRGGMDRGGPRGPRADAPEVAGTGGQADAAIGLPLAGMPRVERRSPPSGLQRPRWQPPEGMQPPEGPSGDGPGRASPTVRTLGLPTEHLEPLAVLAGLLLVATGFIWRRRPHTVV